MPFPKMEIFKDVQFKDGQEIIQEEGQEGVQGSTTSTIMPHNLSYLGLPVVFIPRNIKMNAFLGLDRLLESFVLTGIRIRLLMDIKQACGSAIAQQEQLPKLEKQVRALVENFNFTSHQLLTFKKEGYSKECLDFPIDVDEHLISSLEQLLAFLEQGYPDLLELHISFKKQEAWEYFFS